ncbi:unnamed protein product [Phytomonas sp. EM1]|nr:unnamed protein product [Phytomonas sp. EM1]|eukprot:CCW60493.1 unnamed protein product [Phytomonas sp. isolate EM1]
MGPPSSSSPPCLDDVPPRYVEDGGRAYPATIRAIRYTALSSGAVHRLSALPCRRVIGAVREFGVNDPHLGVGDTRSAVACATCHGRGTACVGHPGHIDLEAPVFHVGFFPAVVRILRTICKRCAHVLLTKEEIDYYTRRLEAGAFAAPNGPGAPAAMDPQHQTAIIKQIQVDAYKTRVCLTCGGLNGVVRRLRPLRIVHEKYRVDLRRGESAAEDPDAFFRDDMRAALLHNKNLASHIEHIHEFLDPARVYQLFCAIPSEQKILVGLKHDARPEDLLIRSLVVPPVCVRPSGPSTSGGEIREDDLTMLYNDILVSSDALKDGNNDTVKYVENWEMLQTRVVRLLDSAMPGYPSHLRIADCKAYAQRMKGKNGRFRGNLSGKRVDFSGRSVISPDPNLEIDELAVPLRVARVLTYPQRVFAHNLDLMRRLVRNGPHVHPGAVTVYLAKESSRKSLQGARDRELLATRLSVGDIVERHVMNGDLILFNRQPSLHRISMMAHRARILPFRTFRFNECCCSPYNADFDGDEMNVHVVQTEEARAEAKELMLTSRNIITAKNGEPIIACTQDFLTAAFLVTSRDVFFDRAQFSLMVSHWLGAKTLFELPIPALLKPTELWTGKQVMEVLLRPSEAVDVLLNLEAKARFYSGRGGEKHHDPAEGFVAFLDSVFISGRFDKKLLGGGAKDGFFARLHAIAGGDYTATCMFRLAQFASRYLQNYGFSLGLGDVAPTAALTEKKTAVLTSSFAKCDALIAEANTGRLVPLPGMTVKQSLEARLNAELSKVRDACGSAAMETLDARSNAPLIMVNSGSKGSALNTAQMMACVGQQTVNGKRIMNAFQDRSLPHFPRYAEAPAARGFVQHSFYDGLTPTEFFFHTMAGREGLVDTAVKTAETGYIYRRLSKAMESLSVQYDGTVRNARGAIIQMRYGEDGMDPWLMEGNHGAPLNLQQEWLAVRAGYARFCQARAARRAELQGRLNAWLASEKTGEGDPIPAVRHARRLLDPDGELARRHRAQHVLSLLPAEVKGFVEGLLEGGEGALARRADREAADRADDAAMASSLVGLQGGVAPRRPPRESLPPLPVEELRRMTRICSARFRADVGRFFDGLVAEQRRLRGRLALPPDARESLAPSRLMLEALQTEILPLTEGMLARFLEACARKYLRKTAEPGTPCGAIAAQSVGEPSTQMTLRTFHFAGVASMNITQGVPRLVEIINANKNIATPIVRAPILVRGDGPDAGWRTARLLQGLVERVLLKEVCQEMVEVISPQQYSIQVVLDMPLIERSMLPIDAVVVRQRLLEAAARPMSKLRSLREDCVSVVSKDALMLYPPEWDSKLTHFNLQSLLLLLPEVVVGGIPGVNRVMINEKEKEILAEGAELRAVMTLPYVDSTRTVCNHVAAVERTLGIEAARQTIINEINEILKAYGLNIDIRHIYLLADVMTNPGVVLGITRYGIQKMDYNILTMASFERTTEHLYNAALAQREDRNLSISESIIIGKPIPLGTAAFSVLMDRDGLGRKDGDASVESTVGVNATSMQPDAFLTDAYRKYGVLGGRAGGGGSPLRRRSRPLLATTDAFHVDLFAAR